MIFVVELKMKKNFGKIYFSGLEQKFFTGADAGAL